MKYPWTSSHRTGIQSKFQRTAFLATLAITFLTLATSVFAVSSASAAGTSSNTISASSAPSDGSAKGSYTPTATASSGDKVVITLDKNSSGCSLTSGKVTFTGSGTCVVDFNDPGNNTYAAAAQVTQSITVHSSNNISLSTPPSAGSVRGSYTPGATATSGDNVVRTLSSSSSGCSLSGNTVIFTAAGTCRVNFNDPGNGAFAAASEVSQSVKVYSANTIYPSSVPGAGTINGTYNASASATSGSTVAITLDATSTGCTISKNVVTFSANGYCRVDFNDPGNGAFAPATQVQQVIIVGTGGPRAQAYLYLTSLNATKYNKLTLTSAGGSGTGAVTYTVSPGTAGCTLKNGVLSNARVGTCTVTVYKAGDATYLAAQSPPTVVTVELSQSTRAVRISSTILTGKTVQTTIIGSGFYGQPRIITSVGGTKVTVSSDNGITLSVRITVAKGTKRGIHTMTLIFAHGERTSLLYNQR